MSLELAMKKIFYVPILQFECMDWVNKKTKIKQIKTNLKLIEKDQFLYTDYFNAVQTDEVGVEKLFEDEISEFKKFFQVRNVTINYSWFEKSLRNNFHPVHNHGQIGYSAVCYVDYCEESHRPIQFVSPFANFVNGSNNYYEPQNVKEGTIIFFPSSINHYTLPNFSDKERLVISFNMFI